VDREDFRTHRAVKARPYAWRNLWVFLLLQKIRQFVYEIDVSSDLRGQKAGLHKELLTGAVYLPANLHLTIEVIVV
jgi:hypothetical protein